MSYISPLSQQESSIKLLYYLISAYYKKNELILLFVFQICFINISDKYLRHLLFYPSIINPMLIILRGSLLFFLRFSDSFFLFPIVEFFSKLVLCEVRSAYWASHYFNLAMVIEYDNLGITRSSCNNDISFPTICAPIFL
jgi:hypothetical protein